jgi:hypothetical protein
MMQSINKFRENFSSNLKSNQAMLLVALLSLISRLAIQVKYSGARFYYPDSWDYVVIPSQLGPPRSFHPPTVWKFWQIFTFGSPSESHVLIIQAGLGVVTTVLLYKILSQFLSIGKSLLLTVIYILTPWQYFFERNFLPESVSLFFVVLLFYIYQQIPRQKSNRVHIALAIFAALILGTLVCLKPLYSVFSILGLILLVVRIYILDQKNFTSKFIISSLCVLTACIPVATLSTVYFKNYGVFSTSPASGSFLITRWANLVSCKNSGLEQQLVVRNVVNIVCERQVGQIPGQSTNLLFLEPDVGATLQSQADFSNIQKKLQLIVLSAILSNSVEFFHQLGEAFIYPFVNKSLPEDLLIYKGGGDFSSSSVVKENFANYETWFDVQTNLSSEAEREDEIRKIMSASSGLPNFIFFFALGLWILVSLRGIKTNKVRNSKFRNWRITSLVHSDYTILIIYVVAVQSMLAATSVINFRLYFSFIPVWIILIGRLISGQSSKERESALTT